MQSVVFCPVNNFVDLVQTEDNVIDGAGVVTFWVTECRRKVWKHELGGFDEGSRLLWNVRGVADYFKGVE